MAEEPKPAAPLFAQKGNVARRLKAHGHAAITRGRTDDRSIEFAASTRLHKPLRCPIPATRTTPFLDGHEDADEHDGHAEQGAVAEESRRMVVHDRYQKHQAERTGPGDYCR